MTAADDAGRLDLDAVEAREPQAAARGMTDAERSRASDWEFWVMHEVLEDDEVSHCGHLDTQIIVPGCQHCAELTAEADEKGPAMVWSRGPDGWGVGRMVPFAVAEAWIAERRRTS